MTPDLSYLQPSGIILLYLVAHLVVGAIMPYRMGRKPFFHGLMEHAGHELDRRLNRAERSDSARFNRGIVTVCVMLFFALVIGYAVYNLSSYPYGWLASFFVFSASASVMTPLKVIREVRKKVAADDVRGALDALQPYFREDFARADKHLALRRALEFSAVSLCRYFIGPLMFFAVFNVTGLLIYVTLTALDEAFGAADPFMGEAVNYIPAHVTVILMSLAAIVVSRASPAKAVSTAIRQARHHRSRNRGRLIAAMAGSLGVTLGGPVRHLLGHTVEQGWIGHATSSAKVGLDDFGRGVTLHFVVFLWAMLAYALLVGGYHAVYDLRNITDFYSVEIKKQNDWVE